MYSAIRLVAAGLTGVLCSLLLPGSAQAAETYYKTTYSDTLYRLVRKTAPDGPTCSFRRSVDFREWASAGYPSPITVPSAFVRQQYEPYIHARTDFDTSDSCGWYDETLTFGQWEKAGYPAPDVITTGWFAVATSDELFAESDQGVHKLTYAEWAYAGHPDFDYRDDQGFIRYEWSPRIFKMDSLEAWSGWQISADYWRYHDFPTPAVIDENTGFYKSPDDPAIYFSDGELDFHVTSDEWAAAGYPTPVEAP